MQSENGLDSHPRFAWVLAMSFPVPPNESDPLRALCSYEILNTKPEERFDELTQLGAPHLAACRHLELVEDDLCLERVGENGRTVTFCRA